MDHCGAYLTTLFQNTPIIRSHPKRSNQAKQKIKKIKKKQHISPTKPTKFQLIHMNSTLKLGKMERKKKPCGRHQDHFHGEVH